MSDAADNRLQRVKVPRHDDGRRLSSEGSGATTNDPIKITIFVGFGTGSEPEQIELHNQIAQEFNESRDDIQIEFITVPYEEHTTRLSTMLAGDMPPDIVMPIGRDGDGGSSQGRVGSTLEGLYPFQRPGDPINGTLEAGTFQRGPPGRPWEGLGQRLTG